MASKMKADGVQTKLRRGTSPSNQGKKITTKSTSSGQRETSPSSSSERSIPNYLRPTISSCVESPKILKKQGPENTSKPSLNRRRSFDRPPLIASQMQKVLPSGLRERALMTKSSSSISSSTVSTKTPKLQAKSMSMPKAVTSRATILKNAKKGSPSTIIKRQTEPSNLVGGERVHDNEVITERQDNDKASVKKVDHCGKIEDRVDVAALHQQELQQIEDEETGESVTDEYNDDALLEHCEDVSITEEGCAEVQREEVQHLEKILLKEKINDNENHQREDYNNHDEDTKNSDEMGVTEVEKKPEDSRNKDVLIDESVTGSNYYGEPAKYSSIEMVIEVGEENNDVINKPSEGQEEAIPTRQVTVKPDGEANTVIQKNQKNMGKDAPVYNDVIAETASKLLEKRKNKVRALVGAFETVISLQEPEP